MRKTGSFAGFTLIELMISVSIFAVIMVAVNLLYLSGMRTYRQSVTIAQMRILTQRAVNDINKDLVDCRIVDGTNLLDQLNFQKPTPRMRSGGNPNTDKRYINLTNGQLYWGDGILEIDGSATVHVGNTIRLEFVQVASLVEATTRVDYNRDADLLDTFLRGRIVRSVRNAGGAVIEQRDLTGSWVFKAPVPGGLPNPLTFAALAPMDLDRIDGPDPVFLILDGNGNPDAAGGRIQVRAFAMSVLDRMPILTNCASLVTPINR